MPTRIAGLVLAAFVAVCRASAPDVAVLERAVAADPENITLGADYRQAVIASGNFDRSIDFFEKLAKRKDCGPHLYVNLALAYVDKVPTAGDIRRLYLGRDAMGALTKAIEKDPTVLAYYMRGLINLYYNTFIFKRTNRGVADLNTALSMVTAETPPALVAHVYVALGDGYFRLNNLAKARETWSAGAARFPRQDAFRERLEKTGEPLADVVTTALSAGRRVDTSLNGLYAAPR
jgi:tetratricopeptide (TPR) repeat protein